MKEYWIADPDMKTIEVYVPRGGVYALIGKWGQWETVESELLPGLRVAVDPVFTGVWP